MSWPENPTAMAASPLSPPLCLHPVILMDFWPLSIYPAHKFPHSPDSYILTQPSVVSANSPWLPGESLQSSHHTWKSNNQKSELRQPLEVPKPPPSPEGQHPQGERLVLRITFCHFNSEFILHAYHKICSPCAGMVCLCGVRAVVTSSSTKTHSVARLGSKEVSFLVCCFSLHTWRH